MKGIATNFLEDNLREYYQGLSVGKDFSTRTAIKEKHEFTKQPNKNVQSQTIGWEKIFTIWTTDKGIMLKTNKNLTNQ